MKLTPRRPRARAAVAMLAGAAVLSVGIASAAPSDTEPTYTGCVRNTGSAAGQLFAVRSGSTPLRDCRADESQVRLSGGDITSITAGTGLSTVGGDALGISDSQGDATLALKPAFRLPQGCTTAQLPARTSTGWKCSAPPPAQHTIVGYAAGPDQIGNDWSTLGSALELPAGSWAIVAKVQVGKIFSSNNAGTDAMYVECRLDATDSQYMDVSTTWLEEFDDNLGETGIVLTGAVTKAAPFHVTVNCWDDGEYMRWKHLRITAISTGDVDVQNL
jgi:hypothetical protein